MEVNKNKIYWLDEKHPNYKRWKHARKISLHRGKFVRKLVAKFKKCTNLKILDLGSGEGGTSEIFSDDNFVVSFDISKIRLNRQDETVKNKLCGNSSAFPFKNNSFDLIIMQDVLEHINYNQDSIKDISGILNDNGIIYLSTPNRNSFLNIITDPHWGFPLVSLLNRNQIRKYFVRNFRKSERDRDDIAELLSLKKIFDRFSDRFDLMLNTRFTLTELINGNPGIIWSRLHLGLIATIKKIRLNKLMLKISNDRVGFVNKFVTPSFYFILFKK